MQKQKANPRHADTFGIVSFEWSEQDTLSKDDIRNHSVSENRLHRRDGAIANDSA